MCSYMYESLQRDTQHWTIFGTFSITLNTCEHRQTAERNCKIHFHVKDFVHKLIKSIAGKSREEKSVASTSW